MQPPSPNSNTDTGLRRPTPNLANHKISHSFWSNPKITLKQQQKPFQVSHWRNLQPEARFQV
eukprot:1145497-Pelagomonas_calceolata.AAC.2